jgi:hypothetical protein
MPLDAVTVTRISGGLQRLIDLQVNEQIDGPPPAPGEPPWALDGIEVLANDLNSSSLDSQASASLRDLARSLRGGTRGGYRTLGVDEHRRLRYVVLSARAVIYEKIARRNFSDRTPTDGTWDYSRLRDEGAKVLFASDFPLFALPTLVREDFDAAATCLLVSVPTGAAMLSLRATEGMVRHVHAKLCPPREDRSTDWAKLAEDIVAWAKTNQRDARGLEHHLGLVRVFRNQAQHPDRTYPLREAQNTVTAASSLVEKLYELTTADPPATR